MSYRGKSVLGKTVEVCARAMHRACKVTFAPILSFLLLLLFPFASQAVFTTPGSFEVNPDGSAGYTIPIQVPPGTGGMAPKLSLVYNSNGGNGPLGMGWSLEGLSQIGRCPRTLAQDGARGGINLDSNDRYCLDGQRLISTGGTYGADGTEYRTEQASFTRIISYGVAGNGPAWFKVWTKGGQVMEYGNTADSRIEAQGKTTVLAWAVNKVSDTLGNYLTLAYTEDNANGETLLNRIDYTGNATATPALAPYASIQFSYTTRADTSTDYLAGSVLKITKRLTNIQTYQGATLVKDYRLSYANNGAYHVNSSNQADGSLITHVQECDGGGTPNCQNSIGFQWKLGTVNLAAFGSKQSWPSAVTPPIKPVQDFNGDGIEDLIDQPTGKVSLGIASGGFMAPQSWGLSGIIAVGDINGDNRTDVTWYNSSNGYYNYAFSTGSSFSNAGVIENYPSAQTCASYMTVMGNKTCVSWVTTYPFKGYSELGDVNGDGLDDVIYTDARVRLYTGAGFSGAQAWINMGTGSMIESVGDLNGDGRKDITWVYRDTGEHVYALSTGKSFLGPFLIEMLTLAEKTQCVQTYIAAGHEVCIQYTWPAKISALKDLNADGAADLAYGNSSVRYALGTTPDQVSNISESWGKQITISNTNISSPSIYAYETNAIYPTRDLSPSFPVHVVSSVSTSDGVGGNVVTSYTYGGAKTDLSGRGFLGFRWTRAMSPDTGVELTTYYRQDYPYIGLPSQSEKRTTSGVLLSAVTTTYANSPITTGSAVSQFPYVSQTQELNYELDGSLVTNTTTSYQYDSYGNATQVVVNSNDGFVKTTANLYANDVSNWLLGRLLRSSVSTVAP